ncbi:MAG: septal ring lytic transglycosylase RlpA family protein [Geobacteraceae bacterium]|nr:septal ring lytic transglycosylase RlpA family protein [Geobacteraceae bacterium]
MRAKRFLLSLSCLLLAACGTTGPRVAVEPGHPGLRPWQRPYTVDGRRYAPLQNADGYREEGLASWYGAEEHGGHTSNGETFDMHKPTAAHKTLPLGCVIRVTNKLNGKTTVARVNDRGPFVEGRIVDLSYRGAKDLDLLKSGVAPVTLEVLDSAFQPPAAVIGTATSIYTLQVAAFTDCERARSVSEKIKKELKFATVRRVDTERGSIYRVHAGRFRSRSDAEAAKDALARNGFPDTFVVTE